MLFAVVQYFVCISPKSWAHSILEKPCRVTYNIEFDEERVTFLIKHDIKGNQSMVWYIFANRFSKLDNIIPIRILVISSEINIVEHSTMPAVLVEDLMSE